VRINATLVSVQSAKPAYAYGQLATVPLKSAEKAGVLRAAIPADVPDNAIVTKAELVFHTREAWTGSVVFSAQRQSEGWSVSKVTWNNRPEVLAGTSKATTVTSPALGQEFRIDVSDHAQAFVAGTATNRGWRIYTDAGTTRDIYGATAGKNKPYLSLTYVVPSDAPTGLVPDGAAVSAAKPTLTFAVPDDTIAIQVQIDAAADALSPDWDSGEVSSPAGLLALSTTTYPGLADGATTYWRTRSKDSLGWSLWSEWATMPRVSKPTVTITSPAATTGDKTPPITWTAPGQVMWQAQLLRPSGQIIDESDRTSSADHEWTPTKGLKRVGDQGRVHVLVWDGVDRVATPGDAIYAEGFFDFTLVAIGDAPGADSLIATQDGPGPVVRLAWVGPVPDLWRITRNGEFLDLIDGSETSWLDYTAPSGVELVYQVLVATDTGEVSPNGPTATIRTRSAGAWLIAPDTDERILMLDEDIKVDMAERAVLHTPLGDGAPVRRRSGTPPPSGTAAGLLLDSYAGDDYAPAAMAETAFAFKGSDQGRVYRLAWGAWNIPVTIGDMTPSPVPVDTGKPAYSVSFLWWQTNDELPWDD
jgi:hypothetical protein